VRSGSGFHRPRDPFAFNLSLVCCLYELPSVSLKLHKSFKVLIVDLISGCEPFKTLTFEGPSLFRLLFRDISPVGLFSVRW
jgi:hypothetical protein